MMVEGFPIRTEEQQRNFGKMCEKRKNALLSDSHMHTCFSGDSDTPVREMIEGAIAKGLSSICITDHNDVDYPGTVKFEFDPEEYFRVLRQYQQEYAGEIDIRIGVEFGLQPHLTAHYEEWARKYPFDFVIGSVHLCHGKDPYCGEIFERSDEEGYREMFEATLENLKAVKEFDVLGHIDYVARYGKQQAKEYSYQKYADYLDEILRRVIDGGKGVELNTAGFKYGLGFCHPHPDIIRRYRELGGEIITVGADAHVPEHIAYDFSKASRILKDCGFKYYTEFRERKPYFCKLP